MRVGVFDLPYMPILHARDGFEVAEWGAHDVIEGRTIAEPVDVANLVAAFPPHALAFDRLDASPDDAARLERLLTECLEGVRRRGALAEALLARTDPSLAIVSFSEMHHAAHHLWHTIEPDSPVYRSMAFRNLPELGQRLEDLYEAVDAQVGRLAALFRDDTVLVCSMHGMQPCRGIPALLPALLEECGFCRRHTWADQSWTARAAGLLGAVKRHAPDAVKRAYYRTMPPAAARRVAKQNLLPTYDWTRTSAFALPSDQHGWIRINLQGREAEGRVPLGRYASTLDAIAQRLRALRRADDGAPIVSDVIRTAHTPAEAATLPIPDLIVHWADAVFASPSGLEGCSTTTSLIGEKFTGQHAVDGFCLVRGAIESRAAIHVTEMPDVILRALGWPAAVSRPIDADGTRAGPPA